MIDVEYKIIGGDGAEYGPANLDELKSWIRDGRVAGATQVWRNDLEAWSPAARYSELHPDLTRLMATVESVVRPAGFWARLGAYLIDHILLCVVFSVIATPVAVALHWQVDMPVVPTVINDANVQHFLDEFATWFNQFCVIYYPIFLIYDVLMNGTFGATLGKMAIGAKITMVDGSRIGYSRALLRWLAARVSDFFLGFGYVMIAIRGDKRAFHDLVAGTKVTFKR